MELDRRTFLKANALTATALSGARVAGANDKLRCATIGTGGRGTYLTKQFVAQGIEVAAVCDVYEPHLQDGLKEASPGARPYEDYRRLLEDKSIDPVIIATPDHRHAQIFIDAVQAGKDVYVEKPMTVFVREGRWMVQAARKYRRVVQVGTQQRSGEHYRKAIDLMRAGGIGDIHSVRIALYRNAMPGFGAPADAAAPPASITICG